MWTLRKTLGNCHDNSRNLPCGHCLHVWTRHIPSTKICHGKKNKRFASKSSWIDTISKQKNCLKIVATITYWCLLVLPCHFTQKCHVTKIQSALKKPCFTKQKLPCFWFFHMIFFSEILACHFTQKKCHVTNTICSKKVMFD